MIILCMGLVLNSIPFPKFDTDSHNEIVKVFYESILIVIPVKYFSFDLLQTHMP